jgi:hypothetical protein
MEARGKPYRTGEFRNGRPVIARAILTGQPGKNAPNLSPAVISRLTAQSALAGRDRMQFDRLKRRSRTNNPTRGIGLRTMPPDFRLFPRCRPNSDTVSGRLKLMRVRFALNPKTEGPVSPGGAFSMRSLLDALEVWAFDTVKCSFDLF